MPRYNTGFCHNYLSWIIFCDSLVFLGVFPMMDLSTQRKQGNTIMIISFANGRDVKQFVDMFGSVPQLHLVDFASHGAIAEYENMVKIVQGEEWKLYTVYDRYDDNNGHRMQYIACKQNAGITEWEIVTVSGYGTERAPYAVPENDGKYPIVEIMHYWLELGHYL